MAKLLVPEGTKDIQVGTPVALLVDEEDQVAAFKGYAAAAGGSGSGATTPAAEATSSSSGAAAAESPPAVHRDSRIGPAARTLLEESGLSPEDVTPTGPHGIITKGDVLAAIEAGVKPRAAAAAAPAAPAAPTAAAAPQQQATQQPAAAPQQQAAAPASAGAGKPKGAAYTDIPNSQIRKIIAQRLQESKQTIPHL